MRLVVAMMKHETNTLSPVKTDWQRFLDWGAFLGPEASDNNLLRFEHMRRPVFPLDRPNAPPRPPG